MTAEMVVALTLWGEARGEPMEGKLAVASVIYNRAVAASRRDDLDRTEALRQVCLKPKQFSCWKDGDLLCVAPGTQLHIPACESSWSECSIIARMMVEGDFIPSTPATHYHTHAVAPSWSANMVCVAEIGHHRFFRERRQG